MRGLELSRGYFEEFGRPMLESQFPEVLPYLAAGLIGSGSECLGFDDETSTDHDFEPGFLIFLPGEEIVEAAEVRMKYSGYIRREREIADKIQRLENIRIRGRFNYNDIQSLSTEARQKLSRIDPETMAQASRIPGVSPSDINVLLVMMNR